MRILLIGYGFIGQHFVVDAVQKGHSVTVGDLRPADTTSVSPLVRHITLDVADTNSIEKLLREHDTVVNLAAILGTSETFDDPVRVLDANTRAPLAIFDALRRASREGDCIPFVQITVGNHFMNNPYAISKHTLERFAQMYNDECGTDIRIVRALNAYGPHQKTGPVNKIIPSFAMAALNREPLTVFGTGNQIMDMIFVADVAAILTEAATAKKPIRTVLEAGTGRRTTVNQIAELVNQISGSIAGIRLTAMRRGEPLDSVVVGDPRTLSPIEMDHHDFIRLEEGLKVTLDWYAAQRK